MKKIFFIFLCFLFIGNILVISQTSTKVFPYSYQTHVLENGLTVVLVPMDSPGIVSYYSVVRTGSRDEWEKGKSGFAHFFEHMMFRGTERYPGKVYDSIMTSIGADANAYTTDDMTVYHQNFASEDLEKIIELEADRFQFLQYNEAEFQTEAGAVHGEYLKNRTSPWAVAFEKLYDTAFDKHTYKHMTIGFEDDIKNMPNLYEFSKSFYKRYYRPENVVLLIVGDIDPLKTVEWVNKYYKDWKPGYVEPQIIPEPEQTSARKAEVTYEGRTLPLTVVAYKLDAFNISNKNYLATLLLSDLSFGETSNIYKKLVLNEQKIQFVSAGPSLSRDPKLFSIYSMVKNENDIDYVLTEINKTINYFQNNLVDENTLENVKKRMRYSFLMNLDSPKNVAAVLPRYITLTGSIDVIDELYNSLQSITPEDLKKAAINYFVPDKSTTIILRGEG